MNPSKPNTDSSNKAPAATTGGHAPLVVSTRLLRVFLCFAAFAIIVSLLQFVFKTFTPADPHTAQLFVTALQIIVLYVSPATLWLRIASLLFAITTTLITILNPHPYNRHCAIVGWIAVALCFFTLFFI